MTHCVPRPGRRALTALPLLLAVATTTSCVDDPLKATPAGTDAGFDPIDVSCEPGELRGCMCDDGRAGTQLCAPSGNELGGCACTGSQSPTDTGDTSDTSDTTGEPPLCGNGVIDGDEQCDDGNSRYDDACNNACIQECGLSWRTNIGRPDDLGVAQDVAVGPDNSIAVVGRVGNGADGDLWLARYDAEGSELWSVTKDLGDEETGQAVAVDANGNILVTATIRSAGGRDIAVYLFDLDGVEQWSDVYDGAAASDDFATGAAFDAVGNAVVSGTVGVAKGDTDLWLRKYDPSGAAQWTETYSGAGNGVFSTDLAGEVAVDGNGNIYAQVGVYVAFDERDIHALKFGPGGGAPIWDVAPFEGGPVQEHALGGLAVQTNGVVVMGINNTATPEGWRFWVHAFDTDGAPLWQTDSKGAGVGAGHSLAGLGIDATGRVGLALTYAQQQTGADLVTVALQADGMLGCQSTVDNGEGAMQPEAATVDGAGNLIVTGVGSADRQAPQRWLTRHRGAAVLR